MEHTHLVKGLDFALLQKVRSEIAVNESEEDAEETTEKSKDKEETVADVEFVSVLGRKIHKAAVSTKPPQRNELFYPGRMVRFLELLLNSTSHVFEASYMNNWFLLSIISPYR